MTDKSDRLHETVKGEAFLWGADADLGYHSIAASHMDSQWETLLEPILAKYPIDYDRTIDFAAGYGRNTRKLLDAGATHVTMVDVNPDCIAYLENNFPADRTTAVLNDGTDLSVIDTCAFTFLYSFDAMVHFDLEIVLSYIPEFSRVLKLGAYALVHHSNYAANPGGEFRQNPHWRNFMSADIFKHVTMRSKFTVLEQHILIGASRNSIASRCCSVMDDGRQRRSEYCKPFRKPTNEVATKKEKHPLDLMIAFYIIKMDKKLVINFSRASPANLLDV